MRIIHKLAAAALGATLIMSAGAVAAQTPAHDPSERLREVLPADVAERVLARIAEARARELPAQALENRVLKFAARGVAPADIERSVGEQVDRMTTAKGLLESSRPAVRPSADEIDAGAEAMRQGVDGAAVSALAKSAPSGRSLAVPLFVIGSLVDRGLPSDEALARVRDRLMARATDTELEGMAPGRSGAARPAGMPGGAGMPGTPGGAGMPGTPGGAGMPTKMPPPPPRIP